MEALLILVIVAALLALGYAAFNFIGVKKLDEGTDRMKEIAAAIRVGANAFITYEYKIIAVVVVIIAIAFAAIFTVQYGEFSWEPSVCFMIGVIMSASAGWVGMKIATYANVRVSNTARNTKNIGSTLKVALKGGSVMGLCVGGFALLGLFLVYIIFGFGLNMLDIEALRGAHVFTQCLSCYALGCSIVAMFNRVGGGIYTKAADMGADLVGKTEAHIPEDDPRNPATIADNVGDNVGDVAGLGSDLLESFVGAISSAIILAVSLYLSNVANNLEVSDEMLSKMMYFPLVFAAIGLIASAAISAFVCGVTEPFEFAFMFLAPALYVVYALLYGIFTVITVALGFRAGFSFSAGLTDLIFSAPLPAAAKTWLIIPLGIAAFIVFYAVFRFAIVKFDLKTPGREDDDDDETKVVLANDDFTTVAKIVLDGVGGKDNVESVDNCITRLRLVIKDYTKVDEKKIKSAGVAGVVRPSQKDVQVIIGTKVQFVADEFKKLCK